MSRAQYFFAAGIDGRHRIVSFSGSREQLTLHGWSAGLDQGAQKAYDMFQGVSISRYSAEAGGKCVPRRPAGQLASPYCDDFARGGAAARAIVIPRVEVHAAYRVFDCLEQREIGLFTGDQLHRGELTLRLEKYGQEILELRRVGPLSGARV